jgi:hypothetical protein
MWAFENVKPNENKLEAVLYILIYFDHISYIQFRSSIRSKLLWALRLGGRDFKFRNFRRFNSQAERVRTHPSTQVRACRSLYSGRV